MCCGGAGVEFRRHRGGPSVPMHDRGSAGFLHRCLQETTGRLGVRGAVPAISRPCESGSPARPTSPRVRSAGQPGSEMSFVSSEMRMLHWRSCGEVGGARSMSCCAGTTDPRRSLATLGTRAYGLRVSVAGRVLRPTLYECAAALPAAAHASRPRSRCVCRWASSLRDSGLRAGWCGGACACGDAAELRARFEGGRRM